MNLPEQIRAAIFDADGTLLDSMRMWDSLDEEFLTRRGFAWNAEVSHDLHAIYFEECPAYFRRKFGIPDTDEEILGEFSRMAYRHYAGDVQEKPGAKALLQALHARGIACCVATASEKTAVTAALDRLGLLPYLSFVLTCKDIGKSKDDPAIFHACAERMGGTAADTAVFEDALHAVETAVSAGFFTVGVYDAAASAQDTAKIQQCAGLYVESLAAIL